MAGKAPSRWPDGWRHYRNRRRADSAAVGSSSMSYLGDRLRFVPMMLIRLRAGQYRAGIRWQP